MEEYALFAAVLLEAGDIRGKPLKIDVLSSNGGFMRGSWCLNSRSQVK